MIEILLYYLSKTKMITITLKFIQTIKDEIETIDFFLDQNEFDCES